MQLRCGVTKHALANRTNQTRTTKTLLTLPPSHHTSFFLTRCFSLRSHPLLFPSQLVNQPAPCNSIEVIFTPIEKKKLCYPPITKFFMVLRWKFKVITQVTDRRCFIFEIPYTKFKIISLAKLVGLFSLFYSFRLARLFLDENQIVYRLIKSLCKFRLKLIIRAKSLCTR